MFVHTSILGEFNSFVFKYSICSADLHGYLVHVPCEPERIDEIMREKYPGNYMISNNKGYTYFFYKNQVYKNVRLQIV